jgi:hypothetical protein
MEKRLQSSCKLAQAYLGRGKLELPAVAIESFVRTYQYSEADMAAVGC